MKGNECQLIYGGWLSTSILWQFSDFKEKKTLGVAGGSLRGQNLCFDQKLIQFVWI